jgi:hypothetical protein
MPPRGRSWFSFERNPIAEISGGDTWRMSVTAGCADRNVDRCSHGNANCPRTPAFRSCAPLRSGSSGTFFRRPGHDRVPIAPSGRCGFERGCQSLRGHLHCICGLCSAQRASAVQSIALRPGAPAEPLGSAIPSTGRDAIMYPWHVQETSPPASTGCHTRPSARAHHGWRGRPQLGRKRH